MDYDKAATRSAHILSNEAYKSTERQQYITAISLYKKAISLDPNLAVAYNNMAYDYEKMNDNEAAIHSSQEAVRLAPHNADFICELAYAYMKSDRNNEALKALRRALALRPKSAIIYSDTALLCHKMGLQTERQAANEQAVRYAPDDISYLKILAHNYDERGRPQDAIKVYRKSLHIKQNDQETRLGLAYSYLLNGNRAGALEQYQVLKKSDAQLAAQLARQLFLQ